MLEILSFQLIPAQPMTKLCYFIRHDVHIQTFLAYTFHRKYLFMQSAVGEPQDAGCDRLNALGPPLWVLTPRN